MVLPLVYWKSKGRLAALLLTSLAQLRPQTVLPRGGGVQVHNNQLYEVHRLVGSMPQQPFSPRRRRASTLDALPPFVDVFYRNHYRHTDNKRMAKLPAYLQPGDIQMCLMLVPEDRSNCNDAANQKMVAGVRLLPTATKHNCDTWYFLRGLCVAQLHQQQGWGSLLLQHVLHNDSSVAHRGVYLFADPTLEQVYTKNGFEREEPTVGSSHFLPDRIVQGYRAIQNRRQRTGKPPVALFVRRPTIRVILLQHANEQRRKTATGQVLLAEGNHKQTLQVELLPWAGRADNEHVEEILLQNNQQLPILLWTGGQQVSSPLNAGSTTNESGTPPRESNIVFVVLDGTWQEARSMFRKIPLLHAIPRWTLQKPSASIYRLRGDYSGWRERFASTPRTTTMEANNTTEQQSSSLFCTAEVVSHLLQHIGHDQQAAAILQQLERFQDGVDPPASSSKRNSQR